MATKDVSDKQVVEAFAEYARAQRWPYDILQERTGQCFKVCWRAMERANRRGLVECGVSLRTGWLTAAGTALLEEA